MNNFKKIAALLMALVMVMAMSSLAMATGTSTAANLTNGEVGGYTQEDTQNLDNKVINIQKEITVYNPNETKVYGPAITYSYAIEAGTDEEMGDITDAAGDHSATIGQVNTTTLPGVVTGIPAIENVVWANDVLDADDEGAANIKNLTINFTSVDFGQPGVFRYKITETASGADRTPYKNTGVTQSTVQNNDVRYLDVYVMRSSTYTESGSGAGQWRVYGYVCTAAAGDITTATAKTSGFVDSNDEDGESNADQYRTYNLTIGKTLVGDQTMNGHKFPFAVAFDTTVAGYRLAGKLTNNAQISLADEVNGLQAVETTTTRADGVPSIPHNGTVTYIGIPNGTKVTVTETNDVTGTTYTTTATEAIGDDEAVAVQFNDEASSAALSTDSTTATAVQSDTIGYVQDAAPTADNNVAIQYTNILAVISPTGYVARIAPYALMLAAGVALLVIFLKRRKPVTEDDE